MVTFGEPWPNRFAVSCSKSCGPGLNRPDSWLSPQATASQLALTTGHSQPLVSQHLRVLLEAGLVRVSPQGRSRLYGLNEEGFRTVAEWLAQYEVFWSERLDRLAEVVEQR